MPNNIVKSFSEKSGKSVNEVEKLWIKAKAIVKKEYRKTEKNKDFFALVTGTLKKMLSIEEGEFMSNSKLIEESVNNYKYNYNEINNMAEFLDECGIRDQNYLADIAKKSGYRHLFEDTDVISIKFKGVKINGPKVTAIYELQLEDENSGTGYTTTNFASMDVSTEKYEYDFSGDVWDEYDLED